MSHGSKKPLDKIGECYTVGRQLGSGSFGRIYLAVSTETGEERAVKIERRCKRNNSTLVHEAKVCAALAGGYGIPNIHHCDTEGDFQVMVLDLLGPSLEHLFEICNRQFSVKTVLMIAEQVLHRIEYVHTKNFVHRDVKPENFLIGTGRQTNIIHLIDYGLALQYRDADTMQHIPFTEGKSLTGTARYASINALAGKEQSRRDDLEAIGHMLVYFLKGSLPWQDIRGDTKEDKYHKILDCKKSISPDQLCEGTPATFAAYLRYCRQLKFEDKPNYHLMRRLFKQLLSHTNDINDGMFDWWLLRKELQAPTDDKLVDVQGARDRASCSTNSRAGTHGAVRQEGEAGSQENSANGNPVRWSLIGLLSSLCARGRGTGPGAEAASCPPQDIAAA